MKKSSVAKKVAEGLGLTALVAGAAAAYYLTGPGGKKHQKQLKAWGKKARAEMAVKVKKIQKLSKAAYDRAAKEVLAKYRRAKNIKPDELSALGQELRQAWTKISRDVSKLGAKKQPRGRGKKRKA